MMTHPARSLSSAGESSSKAIDELRDRRRQEWAPLAFIRYILLQVSCRWDLQYHCLCLAVFVVPRALVNTHLGWIPLVIADRFRPFCLYFELLPFIVTRHVTLHPADRLLPWFGSLRVRVHHQISHGRLVQRSSTSTADILCNGEKPFCASSYSRNGE